MRLHYNDHVSGPRFEEVPKLASGDAAHKSSLLNQITRPTIVALATRDAARAQRAGGIYPMEMTVARSLSRQLKLIHTSDVHLESDTFGAGPRGDTFRDSVRRAFAGVIDIANGNSADILLIVGDLFDSNRISGEALDFAMNQINRAKMPVVLIPGNHDAHDERSIYAALSPASLPPNLHLILDPDGLSLEFPDLSARVWGRALVEHSPEYRPLSGLPEPVPHAWNIGLAHGFFTEIETNRSSPITASEIETSGYDYIALGHIHVFGDVSQGRTRAFYCGTPAPLYAGSEAGWVLQINCIPGQPVHVERLIVGGSMFTSETFSNR
jgi:predicted phosphodiesterase